MGRLEAGKSPYQISNILPYHNELHIQLMETVSRYMIHRRKREQCHPRETAIKDDHVIHYCEV